MELTKEFELVYHPNRRNLMIIPAASAAILFSLFGLWSLFFHDNSLTFWARVGQGGLWLALLGFGSWCVILMLRTAKQTIRLTDSGIALLNEGRQSVCFYKWKSVPCIYSVKSLRGSEYRILSPDALKKGQRFFLTVKAAWLLKMRFEDTFVIWHNRTETADAVFAHIDSHRTEK